MKISLALASCRKQEERASFLERFMREFLKRTWAEINLDAIRHNYTVIRQAVRPQSKICCVVKADAYGHGAPFISRELERMGADWFAVSNLEEAIQLRRCGIQRPILILGYTPPREAAQLHELEIAQDRKSVV